MRYFLNMTSKQDTMLTICECFLKDKIELGSSILFKQSVQDQIETLYRYRSMVTDVEWLIMMEVIIKRSFRLGVVEGRGVDRLNKNINFDL